MAGGLFALGSMHLDPLTDNLEAQAHSGVAIQAFYVRSLMVVVSALITDSRYQAIIWLLCSVW
jgi:hypothetical protein